MLIFQGSELIFYVRSLSKKIIKNWVQSKKLL